MTARSFSVGKLRGLQQIADTQGILAMCAMDHRGSMQRLINSVEPNTVTADVLVEYKRDLTEALAPVSTAVLLDPIYGAAQAIASGALPGTTGLLVSLEETGYEKEAQGRITTLLPGWGVDKIKHMGASAVKILLFYRPDLVENASRQREVVVRVAEDCARADIPFLVEPITYPVGEAEKGPAAFARRKLDMVIESAHELTPLGVDVLKAEFPVDGRYEPDEGQWRAACLALDAASQAPWILLSAGVAFDEFARQVKVACQAGASGFLGGRAIWEEAMRLPDARERRQWLTTTGADRMRRLHDIAGEYGRPWWEKWAKRVDGLVAVTPDWYQSYRGPARS